MPIGSTFKLGVNHGNYERSSERILNIGFGWKNGLLKGCFTTLRNSFQFWLSLPTENTMFKIKLELRSEKPIDWFVL